MEKMCFIVAGMQNRAHFLNECVEHFMKSKHSDCDIYLYFQGDNIDEVIHREIFTDIVIDLKPRGVFTPRYELMKRYAKDYEYTVIIDDDLFILEDTDYNMTANFIRWMGDNAVCAISNTKIKNSIERRNDINIDGGLVIPRRGILEILDYFSDKEKDYTFDYFWLFLYVKGFNLYRDWRTKSKHVPSRKVNGKFSGFNYSRYNMKYIPMMEEWFNPPKFADGHGSFGPQFIHVSDITEEGIAERNRCIRKLREGQNV